MYSLEKFFFLEKFRLFFSRYYKQLTPNGINSNYHTKKRIKNAGLTGITTLSVKGIVVLVGIISIPLTVKYLGNERYGLWLLLSLLLSWISIADLGLASSLTNTIAFADGKEDINLAKEALSSAFWIMVGTAVIIFVLFFLINPYIPWAKVFKVTSPEAKIEVGPAVISTVLIFALRLPLSVPSRVFAGYQKGYFYQLWNGLGNIIGVFGLIIGIRFNVSMPTLIFAFFGTPLIGDLLAMGHLFFWQTQPLKPSFSYFRYSLAKRLLKTGFKFWIIQISAILFMQTDLIIVDQMFGATQVAIYGVALKLFSLIWIVQVAFISPLWPTYCEALARKDIKWITRTYKFSISLSIIWCLLAGILLVIFTPRIVTSWMGINMLPSNHLMIAMYFTSLATVVAQAIGILLSGLEKLKFQIICALCAAIFNLISSIALAYLIGLPGICWGTGLTLFIFSNILGGFYIKRIFAKLNKASEQTTFNIYNDKKILACNF
jgi:O-antigen/teichoic acid export membrane protein